MLNPEALKDEVMRAMKGYTLAKSELIALYKRKYNIIDSSLSVAL